MKNDAVALTTDYTTSCELKQISHHCFSGSIKVTVEVSYLITTLIFYNF